MNLFSGLKPSGHGTEGPATVIAEDRVGKAAERNDSRGGR